jgi:hypothetical protein
MRRRQFITLLGGAAAWPLAARAQQRERMRRIGVFMPGVADDPESEVRNAAFLQGLGELGWIVFGPHNDFHSLILARRRADGRARSSCRSSAPCRRAP